MVRLIFIAISKKIVMTSTITASGIGKGSHVTTHSRVLAEGLVWYFYNLILRPPFDDS